MGQVVKRENIVIVIGEYQKDGQPKKKYRAIGEIVTYQNDDGSVSQFGEMWGPTGCTEFSVYEQQDRQQSTQNQQAYQQPYQQPQQLQQQQPSGMQSNYQQPPQY